MKVLIVNPIIYTSETRSVKKVNTIKDTMIYDLCLAFKAKGAEVTLAAAEDYKPNADESYPFEVVWLKTRLKKLCPVNTLPYCPDVKKLIKNNYDLIITSEVFSLNSLMLAVRTPKNLIVWHELAKHNRIFHGLASRFWYGVIAKLFFKKALVVGRSEQAKEFISSYCKNVSDTIIDHGVNLEKFTVQSEKENYFAISSQLIERKRIDKSITAFADYVKKYDSQTLLYIMGEGNEKGSLVSLADRLGVSENIIFTGKLAHSELVEMLQGARAMLVYTRKDNNMVSVVESIAVGTPVITTSVPYNAAYIKANRLGIVSDDWGADDLKEIADNKEYISNCIAYRKYLPTEYKVRQFTDVYEKELNAY